MSGEWKEMQRQRTTNHEGQGKSKIARCATKPPNDAGGRSYIYIIYNGPPNGPIQRPKPVSRYVQCGCCKTTARSETRKLARVGPARCPAWGIWPKKSGKNGHLLIIRANGAIGGPYCSPTWPSACRRQCGPLVGRGGYFLGGGAAPAPPLAPWGASSIRVPKKNARCPGLLRGLPSRA
jgi:hypothetical protein